MTSLRSDNRKNDRYYVHTAHHRINVVRLTICMLGILVIMLGLFLAANLIVDRSIGRAGGESAAASGQDDDASLKPGGQEHGESSGGEKDDPSAGKPYYYDVTRAERYAAYAAAHPEFPEDDVIWMVNVDLDKPFYEDTVMISDVDAVPVLVNKHFYFPDSFVPKDLVAASNGWQVTRATLDAFNRMKQDASAAGYPIDIQSAYRSIELQIRLYNEYLARDGSPEIVDTYSSRPGYSEHHTGHTIDLVGSNGDMERFGETTASPWVYEHAWEYGFIVRYTDENRPITGYKSEPWHITYVGDEAAKIMHDNAIGSLEEYFAKYILAKPE
ncbi:MAG: M15 family metallopeptidase [Clostridiales Family XIII bacterium]|nr:M15 family metallopeptidase [Clostridiales Family XIII bacterium]